MVSGRAMRNVSQPTINKEVDVMRELTATELRFVSGGADVCTAESSGSNTYGGVGNTTTFGQDMINFYEGLIEATSYVMERVANAL